jgi:hypothetical protein
MRFAQTVVSEAGLWDPAANPVRVARLGDLLHRLRDDGVGLAVLPAGYLTVAEEEDVPSAAATIADLVEQTGVAVVGGVDVVDAGAGSEIDDLIRGGRLPFFGFAARPTRAEPEVPIWRQSSVSGWDAEFAPDGRLPDGDRVVRVGDRCVAVLLCGELFSDRARDRVAALGADAVVDLGHARMSQGLIPAMASVAKAAKRPVAHSQHLAGRTGRSLHYVAADGSQKSVLTDGAPHLEAGEFWIGWHVREV